MPSLTSGPNIPSMGSVQQRAASLRAAAEAAAKRAGQQQSSSARQSSEQTQADPYAESPGPVGAGQYVVRKGDCVSSIAKTTGHFWETIWNDPGNAELRDVRKNPNVLLPGDRLAIPELRPKEEPGETEMRHRFVRRGEPSLLRLVIKRDGEPVGNAPFTLDVDGQVSEGTTGPDGKLETPIPGNARVGKLTVGDDPATQLKYVLNLGNVPPITEIVGVQQRLLNLGFDCGGADGVLGERTRTALRDFQRKFKLPATGEPDEPTRTKLVEEHKC